MPQGIHVAHCPIDGAIAYRRAANASAEEADVGEGDVVGSRDLAVEYSAAAGAKKAAEAESFADVLLRREEECRDLLERQVELAAACAISSAMKAPTRN